MYENEYANEPRKSVSQRHAHADFVNPFRNAADKDAIQADSRKQQGHTSESLKEDQDESPLRFGDCRQAIHDYDARDGLIQIAH